MAAGLLALGILPEQRVAVASATRVEWLYADLAIMCVGGATTAVYPSTTAGDVAYILADSGTRIVFAEDDSQVAKLRAQRDRLPDLIRVVVFDGQADGEWLLSLADLQALGAKHLVKNPTSVDEAVAAVQSEHLATLIYTSGTTGRPKGVELPHRCWTYIGAGASPSSAKTGSERAALRIGGPLLAEVYRTLEDLVGQDLLVPLRRKAAGVLDGAAQQSPDQFDGGCRWRVRNVSLRATTDLRRTRSEITRSKLLRTSADHVGASASWWIVSRTWSSGRRAASR